ncbi:hypothetical protein LCGC14_0620500 [marine sediment metagenome]|uniref:Uncharacterized protein n=1 Tax=marine sediment metagenome TaxID=412755 RepID=A0A0F9RP76_9ZZZZ
MKKWLALLIFIIVFLVACGPAVVDNIEPTPTREAVPTEVPVCEACEGRVCLLTNPCMQGENSFIVEGKAIVVPDNWGFWFDYSSPYQTQMNYTDISRDGTGFRIDLTYFQGYAGLRIPFIELEPANCYVLRATSTTDIVGDAYVEAGNISVVARSRIDGVDKILGVHPIVRDYGTPDMTMGGEREYLWPLHVLTSLVARLDVGVRSIWATPEHGSFIRFNSITLETTNDYQLCSGIPALG